MVDMENIKSIADGVLDQLRPYGQPIYKGHVYFQEFLSVDHNAIPHLAWEEELAKTTGLSLPQLRFTLALFATAPFAAGIRLFRNSTLRHIYSLVTGLLLVYYPFGSGVLHVLPMAVAAYLALLLAPRQAGMLAWCTVFPYIIYLHVANASGEAWKNGEMDFTGGAMVAVLKLIALCVSRQDSFRKNKEDLNSYQTDHQLVATPGLLSYVSYIFGLGNLLAGPFIEYSEYEDFIKLKGPWDPRAERPMPNVLPHGLLAFLESLSYMALYLALTGAGWSLQLYHSAWYYAQPWPLKCAVFCVVGLVYQLRYYFSWKIIEAAYVFAGLDWAGWDPATGKPQWGRCRNASVLGVWLADSARNVPLNWNICTGIFLRRYVYDRVTPRNRRPGFGALLFTQMVSGIWHGLYAGYVFFFTGSAVWIYFSQVLYKAESYLPSVVRTSLAYRAIKIAWTAFVLNYMASAFLLLDARSCLKTFASLHYFPFILMLVVNVMGSFIQAKRAPRPPTGPAGPTPNTVAGTRMGVAKAE